MTTAPTDIFISHSSKDKSFAWRLRADLQVYGIKVWLDEEQLGIGKILTPEIDRAIGEAKYIGLLISSNSIKSKWVKKEIDMSITRNKQLLPILIEKITIPRRFADSVYADFSEPENDHAYHRAFHQLLRQLGCHPDPHRNLVIYHDGLSIGWENASWNGNWQEKSAEFTEVGKCVFSAKLQAYGGVAFRFRSGIDTSPYASFMFSIHGGRNGGQRLKAYFNDRLGNGVKTPYHLDILTPNMWRVLDIPLLKLDAESTLIFKVNWSDVSGECTSAFCLADIFLRTRTERC